MVRRESQKNVFFARLGRKWNWDEATSERVFARKTEFRGQLEIFFYFFRLHSPECVSVCSRALLPLLIDASTIQQGIINIKLDCFIFLPICFMFRCNAHRKQFQSIRRHFHPLLFGRCVFFWVLAFRFISFDSFARRLPFVSISFASLDDATIRIERLIIQPKQELKRMKAEIRCLAVRKMQNQKKQTFAVVVNRQWNGIDANASFRCRSTAQGRNSFSVDGVNIVQLSSHRFILFLAPCRDFFSLCLLPSFIFTFCWFLRASILFYRWLFGCLTVPTAMISLTHTHTRTRANIKHSPVRHQESVSNVEKCEPNASRACFLCLRSNSTAQNLMHINFQINKSKYNETAKRCDRIESTEWKRDNDGKTTTSVSMRKMSKQKAKRRKESISWHERRKRATQKNTRKIN